MLLHLYSIMFVECNGARTFCVTLNTIYTLLLALARTNAHGDHSGRWMNCHHQWQIIIKAHSPLVFNMFQLYLLWYGSHKFPHPPIQINRMHFICTIQKIAPAERANGKKTMGTLPTCALHTHLIHIHSTTCIIPCFNPAVLKWCPEKSFYNCLQ